MHVILSVHPAQDFDEEQDLVARLMLQLRADGPDTQFAVLRTAQKRLAEGGHARLAHTLPALGFAALRLVREIAAARAAGEAPMSTMKEVGRN